MAVRVTLALLAGALHANAAGKDCLIFQGDGCHSITDQTACEWSRSGIVKADYKVNNQPIPIRDEPCVWCGGEPCSTTSYDGSSVGNLCEPKAFVVAARPFGLTENDTFATCETGATPQDTFNGALLNNAWYNERVKTPASKFKEQLDSEWDSNTVCRSAAGPSWVGLTPLDDPNYEWGYRIWTAKSLEDCKGLCGDDCTGVEWDGATMYCEVWYDVVSHFRVNVTSDTSTCWVKDVNCLDTHCSCRDIEDVTQEKCTRSRNGKEGQPCAWCGGDNCITDDNTSKCVSMDDLFTAVKDGTATDEAKNKDTTMIAHCNSESEVGTPKKPRANLIPALDMWLPVTFPPVEPKKDKEQDQIDVKKVVALVGVAALVAGLAICYCCKSKPVKKTRAAKLDREVQPLIEQPKAREVQAMPVYQYQVAPLGVTGRYQYLGAECVEGCRPFTDAPTVLTNVQATLRNSRLFRGPRVHQAGDQLTVSGPPGTMVHVVLGETNAQAAKLAMHQAMTQQGWDYFDVQMAADGVVGHRIYLAQLQQPITISLSTPTSFFIVLTHTPLIPATYTPGSTPVYTPGSTPGSISFPTTSFVR